MCDSGVAGEERSGRRVRKNLADLACVKGRAGESAAPVVVIEIRQQRLPAQPEIDNQPGSHVIGVLHIEPEHVLAKIVELLAALAEGIHLARQEVEQRIVAVLAGEIEDPVVVVVIVLDVAGSEQVHAEGDLVFAAQNIHVVGFLEAGDWESAQRTGAAADGESAVIDGHLQEIVGALVEVRDSQCGGIDSVGVRTAVVAPAPQGEMEASSPWSG